ncbi:MAG: cytochrome C, partial [Gammaproteobacteria bacterium]|nr:cytochrome C [Gammaproteobacteria bacterium]
MGNEMLRRLSVYSWIAVLLVWGFLFPALACARVASEKIGPIQVRPDAGNVRCLSCHGEKGFSVPTGEGPYGKRKKLYLDWKLLDDSVHGERRCVECHSDIQSIPHREGVEHRVDCIRCHSELKEKYKATRKGWDREAVSRIVRNIAFYMESVHAQPRKDDFSRANAHCSDCHDGHAIFPKGSAKQKQFLLETPRTCGGCHPKQLTEYEESVHGVAVLRYGKETPAVCADCHSSHQISKAGQDPAKLVITKSCGSCHQAEYASYTATYHGKVNTLGFTHTAKCFDCHDAHTNRRVFDPRSRVKGKNREQTCLKCHQAVSPGFLTFLPHGNTHDFERYPEMWLASKSMILLLAGVFLFFWSHSALWFYRERKERKQLAAAGITVKKKDLPERPKDSRHVKRFPWVWRGAHLLFALSIMLLAFTGMTVMYSDSFWAPWVARVFGGAETMSVLHRFGAMMFAGVFFIHLAAVLHKVLWRQRNTFQWFGPRSLVPRLQDLWDFIAMMRWFFGKGPRPLFDHWTYWEKFDYWAPFWGMFIIGASGLALWFPKIAGEYFPGWIFNVATIVHGEEAFLAIVFIFTVHFFNCHFRPDKFPLDIMMFVGRAPLESFKEEHQVEYLRLKESGQLEALLADPPSSAMKTGSKILGFTLVA